MFCLALAVACGALFEDSVLPCAQCSVGGISYGTGITEIERAAARREGRPLPASPAAKVSSGCTGGGTSGGSNARRGESGHDGGGGPPAQSGRGRAQGSGKGEPVGSGKDRLQGSADRPEGSGRPGASRGGEPYEGEWGGDLGGNGAAPHATGSVPAGDTTGASSGGVGTVGGRGGALGGSTAAPGDAGAPARRAQGFNFADARLTGGAWQREARPALLREFFRVLAVCHTVIPDGAHTARH